MIAGEMELEDSSTSTSNFDSNIGLDLLRIEFCFLRRR